MKDLNEIYLTGNLTADCTFVPGKNDEKKNGIAVFSVAVNRYEKNGDDWREVAEFYNCKIYGNLANAVHERLLKGAFVCVKGHPVTERWRDDEAKEHTRRVVIVDYVYINPTKAQQQLAQQGVGVAKADPAPTMADIYNIPF